MRQNRYDQEMHIKIAILKGDEKRVEELCKKFGIKESRLRALRKQVAELG